jgi:lipoyl(octanoyl) transferase
VDKQQVIFRDLGVIEYKQAWDYQESLLQANVGIKSAIRKAMEKPETVAVAHMPVTPVPLADTVNYLLFCEHPAVYTLGKSGKKEHVLLNDEELADREIAFFNTNRGGDITFHGPQQLVGYPILDLEKFGTDIGKYLRNLEEVVIRTLAAFGIPAGRSSGETGVWIDSALPGRERKICAIGVRCSRWITMHGFALNVNTDLGYFQNIIPCGIQDKQVTSMEKELGHPVNLAAVKEKLRRNFEEVFAAVLIQEAG